MVDPQDIVFTIGVEIYGAKLEFPHHEDTEKSVIVDFGYMKQFMKDVFLAYGVTPERAEICSEVLIEADRRGIDSHGLGRLKPIYCDRMDQGILWPDRPIEIIKESDTTGESVVWFDFYGQLGVRTVQSTNLTRDSPSNPNNDSFGKW